MSITAFTMDTDWSPASVVDYVFDAFVDPRLKWTVFCTDPLPRLELRPETEIALHYNVERLGFEASVREIHQRLPKAVGARGHSLAISERLRPVYRELGIRYDSSYLMYRQGGIFAFPIARGVWEFPVFFMDAFFMDYDRGDPDLAPQGWHLEEPGLKVLDFHPVHLALNTPSFDYYQRYKQHYHDLDALIAHQHCGWGMRSLFLALQDYVLTRGLEQTLLADLTDSLQSAAVGTAAAH